jgi:hypothetical protein
LLDAVQPLEAQSPPTLVEGQDFFDNMARRLLAISGDEFVRRYYAGRYDDILDDPHHSDLMYLAMLGGLGRSARTQETDAMALRHRQTVEPFADLDADDAVDPSLPPMRLLTISESQAFFDDMVRRRLGISGDEFVRRYYAGRYDDILDDPHYSDLMYLAMLGDLGR